MCKINRIPVLVFLITSFSLSSVNAQESKNGIYIRPVISYELIALKAYREKGDFVKIPFETNTNKYFGVGIEIGKSFSFGQLGLLFQYGKSRTPRSFKNGGGSDTEVEFENNWTVGFGLQKITKENSLHKKARVQFGSRLFATYNYFDGYRVFVNHAAETETIERFSDSVFGIEMGFNVKIGSHENKKVSFILEPLYLKIMNKGIGLGLQRIGLEIKL